jgi:hypothetical protein
MPVENISNTEFIKATDTVTTILLLLLNEDGTNYDLNDKTITARFLGAGKLLLEKQVTTDDNGYVVIRFDEGDYGYLGIGNIQAEIVVTDGADTKIFPNDGYLEFGVVYNTKSLLKNNVNVISLQTFEQSFSDMEILAYRATDRANAAADRVEALEPEIANMRQLAEAAEAAAQRAEQYGDLPLQYIGEVGNKFNYTNASIMEEFELRELNLLWFIDYIPDRETLNPSEWDWSPAINRAFGLWGDENSKLYRKHYTVKFPPNVEYKIKSMIIWNPQYVSIDAAQCKIQTVGTNPNTFDTGLLIETENNFADWFNSQAEHKGFWISGERVPGTYAIRLNRVSGSIFTLFRTTDFDYSTTFGSNVYIVTFRHCNIADAMSRSIYVPSGLTNFGERVTYEDCNLGGSDFAFEINNDIGLHLKNCSLDYTYKGMGIINAGSLVEISGSHIEGLVTIDESLFQLNAPLARLNISNSRLVFTGEGDSTMPYLFDGTGGVVVLKDVVLHNGAFTSGKLASDNIALSIEGVTTDYTNYGNAFHQTSFYNDAVADGNFNNNIVVDNFFISADTGQIIDKLTAQNMKLTLDKDNKYNGEQSLRIAKQYGIGGGSTGKVTFAFPLDKYDINKKQPLGGFRFAKLNSNGVGGVVKFIYEWALLDLNNEPIPLFLQSKEIVKGNIDFSANTTREWYHDKFGRDPIFRSRPAWANFLTLTMDFEGYDGNNGAAFINVDGLHFEMI